MVGDVI